MIPHYYWMRPDPDGRQRRANEARAAAAYQGARRIGRLAHAASDLAWRGARALAWRLHRHLQARAAVSDCNEWDGGRKCP